MNRKREAFLIAVYAAPDSVRRASRRRERLGEPLDVRQTSPFEEERAPALLY
jgi:hypothetical protein